MLISKVQKPLIACFLAWLFINASARTPEEASKKMDAAGKVGMQANQSASEPKAYNRQTSHLTEDGRVITRLDERAGDGVVWWPHLQLSDGTIEVDVRGKDVPQKSFVGLAFHGMDETSYDAVYFRPFNFRAANELSRSHAVQYISMPGFDWQKLRSERPGQYENAITPTPDPDGWFHVRLVIAYPRVQAFVDGASEPALVVNQLSDRRTGWVGFWVGNGSSGDFANLKVGAAKPGNK